MASLFISIAARTCVCKWFSAKIQPATSDSINYMAGTQQQHIGINAFTRLPENWRPGYEADGFDVGALPAVRENVELIAGLLDD
jgi:hypothetical protein